MARAFNVLIPDTNDPEQVAHAVTNRLVDVLQNETLLLVAVGLVEAAKERVGEETVTAALGLDDAILEALAGPPNEGSEEED